MPMPIMPNWIRSLAGTGRGEASSCSGLNQLVFAANDAPAAAAPISRNLRRENLLIISAPRFLYVELLFLQFPDRDFLEKNNVVVAVILQADVAFERP
jgi:hypothetical protein